MPGLEIREMAADEIEEVVRVWERSRWAAQPALEQRMGYSHADNLRFFRDAVARECQVWLAVEGPGPVGLLALAGSRIEQLYVDPPCQGRGVGGALLLRAKELSPEGLGLFTHQANARARAFYEGRGFRPVAFGVSPPPESEPDVEYAWTPAGAERGEPRLEP